jgi:hypothetical protein
MTIDMKNYAGEESTPAAGEQQVQNSDQQEAPEAPPVEQSQEQAVQAQEPSPPPQTPQELPQERNFKALASEVERLKADRESDRKDHQLQLEMMRANMAPKPEPAPQKMFHGMEDSDIPNVKEIRGEWDRREAEYQQRIEELQVAQRYPDYAEVVEKFALPLVKEKPHLAEGIQGARNKALFAYELGKMAQQMKQQQVQAQPITPPSVTAQKMIDNSRKPVSLAAAGGQGVLSKADYYANMSDAEFMKLASKNLGEI